MTERENCERINGFLGSLPELGKMSVASSRILDDYLSSRPDTRQFLEARGLRKVSELDEDGRKELTEHLLQVLANALDGTEKI